MPNIEKETPLETCESRSPALFADVAIVSNVFHFVAMVVKEEIIGWKEDTFVFVYVLLCFAIVSVADLLISAISNRQSRRFTSQSKGLIPV